MNLSIQNFRFKQNDIIAVTLVSLSLFVYTALLSFFSFPLTEGWFETLAWMGNSGVIYRDFNFALPPLMVNLISIGEKLNFTLLEQRLIFIPIAFLQMFLLARLSFEISRNFIISLISAFIIISLIYITNRTWLPKDYHPLVSIEVSLSLILLIAVIKSEIFQARKSIILGLISGLMILTKQNVALIFILSAVLTFYLFDKRYIRNTILYVFSIIITLAIYSLFFDFAWIDTYRNNDSKGSLRVVLSRIISAPNIVDLILKSFIACALFTLFYFASNSISKIINYNFNKYFPIPFFVIFIYLIFYQNNNQLIFALSVGLAIFYLNLFYSIDNKNEHKDLALGVLALPCLGLFAAGTLTAGYNMVSLEIPVLIFITLVLLKTFDFYKNRLLDFLLLMIAICSLQFYFSRVASNSYSWWGYSVSPMSGTTKIKEGYLEGIYVDGATQDILNATKDAIYKNPSATLLSTPNIPIFYKLYDKPPVIRSPILWFDVVKSNQIPLIKEDLNLNKPDLIFWLKPPRFVYEGHASLRETVISAVSVVDEFIMQELKKKNYKISYVNELNNASYKVLGAEYPLTKLKDDSYYFIILKKNYEH